MTPREIERIAVLETRVQTLIKNQEEQAVLLREVRDALVSARGAKLVLFSLVSVSGIVGGIISQFFPR